MVANAKIDFVRKYNNSYHLLDKLDNYFSLIKEF